MVMLAVEIANFPPSISMSLHLCGLDLQLPFFCRYLIKVVSKYQGDFISEILTSRFHDFQIKRIGYVLQ